MKKSAYSGICKWIFCDPNYYYKAPREALTEESPPPVQLLHTDTVELPHLGDLCLVLGEGQLRGQHGGTWARLLQPGLLLLTYSWVLSAALP